MGRTGFVGQGTRGAVPRRRAGSSLRISRSFVARRAPHKLANLGEARDLGFVSSRPNNTNEGSSKKAGDGEIREIGVSSFFPQSFMPLRGTRYDENGVEVW